MVSKVSDALAKRMSEVVTFPSTDQRLNEIKAGFMPIANFPGVIGLVDGCHIRINIPQTPEDGSAYYSRKSLYSLNAQFVIDHEMKVTDLVCRWPGSTHDSTIFKLSKLYTKLASISVDGHLLGDCGYE